MSLRTIFILIGKELRQGTRSFLFIYSLVMPVLLTLLVTLVFGDLFAQQPRLGVTGAADSQFVTRLLAETAIETAVYDSEADLRAATARGTVELGIILPADFDTLVQQGATPDLHVMRWGESPIDNLLVLESSIATALVETADFQLPITVNSNQLGNTDDTSWAQRFLPLIIIMAVTLGGILIPSSSLIDEKQKRTLSALTTSPATLLDVYLSKMVTGMLMGTLMGVIILLLNNAFGGQPALLITIIMLGALMTSGLGMMLGTLVNDMDGLLATIKAFGIVLFGPGIVELIPPAPEWIGRLFPTYYMMNPLLEIGQRGAGLADVAGDLGVLLALVGATIVGLVVIIERQKNRVALA